MIAELVSGSLNTVGSKVTEIESGVILVFETAMGFEWLILSSIYVLVAIGTVTETILDVSLLPSS